MPMSWWLHTITRFLHRDGASPRPKRRVHRWLPSLDLLEERETPSASLSAGNATFTLNAGTTNVVVTRTGDLTPQVTISYRVSNITAINGTNYQANPTTGTLLFPSGVRSQSIPVTLLPNNFTEANRTFSVDLTGVVDVLGPPATFAAKQDVATGTGASFVLSSDLNNDGRADLIVANGGSNTVTVRMNTTATGATAPALAMQKSFVTGINPVSVSSSDVNGDGKLDLIVANSGSNSVSVLLNTTTPGMRIPSFAPQVAFLTGVQPSSVTSSDLNGDGKLDLIVANFGSKTVSVLLNTTSPGATTPTFTTQKPFAAGTSPVAVSASDVNGDGKADLLVANRSANSVSVLLNTTSPGATTPTFTTQKPFAAGTSPVAVSASDVNGDGKADLLVANRGSGSVSVLLNTTVPGATSPTFAPQKVFATGTLPSSVLSSDLNGDGKPDLILPNRGSNNVSVLLNTTEPGATTPTFATQTKLATGSTPVWLSASDLNGDGRTDLLIANSGSNTVSVLLNTTSHAEATAAKVPAPLFPQATTFPTGTEPNSLSLTDVNGDGKADLIVTNVGSNTVSVRLNTTAPGATTPSYGAQNTFSTGDQPFNVWSSDVNGDGRPDLVVANVNSNNVSVLLNTTAPGATTPSFTTQKTFATGRGPEAVLLADVNGDGKADMIVANNGASSVSVFLSRTPPGATTPAFAAAQSFATGTHPSSLAWSDVNGDGKMDLITTNFSSNTVSVLLNTTTAGARTASFATQQVFTTGINPGEVSAADVNGDGRPDLVVSNRGSNSVSVLLNRTTPGAALAFAAQKPFATGSNPVAISVADLNGDGKPDLVVPNFSSKTVSVLFNTTVPGAITPSFAAQQAFATGINPVAVSVLDVNGDGAPDLLVANRGSNTVSVLLNTPVVLMGNSTVTLVNAPVVSSITRTGPDRTSAASLTYTVTFSKAVSGVTVQNFSLSGTATSGGRIGVPTTSDGGVTWSVLVATGVDGTLGLNLSDRTGIHDANGNQIYNTSSDAGSTFTTVTGPLTSIDRTSPTITIGGPSSSITTHQSITYTIVYSDANFNASTLTAADIKLNTTGTATGTVSVDAGTGSTRTVTISNITGDGSLGISVAANTANDTFGLQAPAAGPSATFIVDNTPPSVTIIAPIVATSPGESVTYTIKYLDANFNASTLTAADIKLNTTGTATGTVSVDAGTGNTRTVTISGITGNGTLGICIAANTANDKAGNQAAAAGPSDTFTVVSQPDNSGGVGAATSRLSTNFV